MQQRSSYNTNLTKEEKLSLPLYPEVYAFLMKPDNTNMKTNVVANPYKMQRKVPPPVRLSVETTIPTATVAPDSSSSSSQSTLCSSAATVLPKVKNEKIVDSNPLPLLKPAMTRKRRNDDLNCTQDSTAGHTTIDLSILDSSDELSVVGTSPDEVIDNECTIITPRPAPKKAKNMKPYPPTPLPLHIIKQYHPLFFTYDPRGVKKGTPLPIGHCKYCRCPTIYCSDMILGKITADHTQFLLCRNEGENLKDDSTEGLKYTFRECFSEAVMSKMRTNGIFFPFGFKLDTVYRLPLCVKNGSLRRFLIMLEEDKENEENNVYDMTKDRIRALTKRYCARGGGECKEYLDEPLN